MKQVIGMLTHFSVNQCLSSVVVVVVVAIVVVNVVVNLSTRVSNMHYSI